MSETALGIDIGSHAVKAVLLRRRGSHIQVLKAGSAPLEELGHMEDSRRKTTKIAMIVRNLLRTIGVRGHPARTAVSGRKSIIRYTRVPPAPAWRLKMLIDYEIEGDTEGKGKDLAYDFRLLDLPTSHIEFTVMMAMARTELVESQCDMLHEAGLAIANVTLSPFPLFNTYAHSRGQSIEDDKTYLLVDIGSENLNVAVQRNGKLFFARNISPGGRAFTEAVQDEFRLPFAEAEELKRTKGRLLMGSSMPGSDDETQVSPGSDAPTEISGLETMPAMVDDLGPELSDAEPDQAAQLAEAMFPVAGRLASAIQSSLMYCRAQTRMPDLEVDEVVLTGGGSKLPGIRQVLSNRLGIPVMAADALRNLDLGPLRRQAREILENDADTYSNAIGLALSGLKPDAVDFCLLPSAIKNRRNFLERTIYLWLAGAAMLAMMCLVGFSSWTFTSKLEDHVNRKEAKLAENNQAKTAMNQLLLVNRGYAREISVMDDILLCSRQLQTAFAALTRHVPPEVIITRFASTLKGPANEVIVEGYVLKQVKQPGGKTIPLHEGHAHDIIGRLAAKLKNDPVFAATPQDQPAILRERVEVKDNTVAVFTLRLLLSKVKNDTSVGRK